jgi:type IV pilus assembly protein PilY1
MFKARIRIRHLLSTLPSLLVGLFMGYPLALAATPTAVPVSQVPLTIAIPAHPQVMIAVGNSQSMDGTLSGAIMTGAGALSSSYSALQASSSPVNFTIPAGFTPPVNAGSGGVAPNTVTSGSNLVDNSPSRLNVAKAGLTAVLNTFMTSADFGLIDYSTSGNGEYTTWVYDMSPPGGFTFTNLASTTTEQVANPCYNVNISLTNAVSQDCSRLNTYFAGQSILTMQYMNVGASSDDPSINDVLYDGGGEDPVTLVYGGPTPANPYPPNFSLAQFNAGGASVYERYSNNINTSNANETNPTNAGYVPYSTQVMYIERGFGFDANQSANTGTVLVPMTSAGASPTASSTATAIAAFTPYLLPETSSTGTTEIKASAVQAPLAGLVAKAKAYFATNPASSNGCTASRYLLLITDGLPTMDMSGASWPPLGSTSAAGYGVTATFNANGSLGSTNDQALKDVITQLTALQSAGVNTYIIGVGAGVDPSLNPVAAQTLTAMAIAGGTGSYFAATSPTALTLDLNTILASILAATQSVASVAVNSTGLSTTSVIYQSQFLSSDSFQDWTGNLYAFPVTSSGTVDTVAADAQWSAATQLDGQNWDTGRLIATWDPVAGAGTPFRWSTSTTTATGIASSTTLGQDLQTFTPDTSGADVVPYLRGSNALEVRNGGQFRNRTHKLGDIVFSNPLYIGAPSGAYSSSSYVTFATTNKSRSPVLYVGADDGMLHAFDATTGNERFAYIPRGVYANLINLVSPYYNSRHLFYVDGSPQSADVQFSDNSWHTIVIGTEGAGGASVFALDVTNPTNIVTESGLASNVLWDFTETNLGLTYSNPVVVPYGTGQIILMGNGYDNVNEKPYLYALNPQTGALYTNGGGTAKIDLCAAVPTACNLTVANGLSSVIAVNSQGQPTAGANIVYAGDLQGNLWRIDISNSNPSNWSVSVLFQARDASGNMQPITTAPVATLNPRYPQLPGSMVFVGTGQLLGIPDLSNTKVQTIYGVYDSGTPSSTPITRATGSLVQQTLAAATISGTQVAVVTGNAVTIPTNNGWYIDLTLNSGERVVNTPLLRNGGLVVTSTQPATSSCTAGGLSYLYVINYATGSAFPSPQFTVNAGSSLTSGNTVTTTTTGYSQVPIGTALGSGFYADATIVNTGSAASNYCTGSGCTGGGGATSGTYLIYNCPENGTACTPRLMKGASKRRIAWWEVRQ